MYAILVRKSLRIKNYGNGDHMNTEITQKEFEYRVKQALEKNEFQAYYQAQYDAITNRLTGAEALIRWLRPDGSIVMPGEFIPKLEGSGLVREVDWYILHQVCRFLKERMEQGLHVVPISVNASRVHILEQDFVQQLCQTVDGYGIERKWIIVEITESALVEHSERIEDWVKEIREAGFYVAIDDFGSGLSSLSFVKDVAVDELKIDKSLLSKNCEQEEERIVLESIFNFAHRLKLTTVAEGVETREQLGFLRTCGCKVIQGYLFAKPIPETEFHKLCDRDSEVEQTEDILTMQAPASATQLLLDAVFMAYPLVIFSNLTRNSYYMMAYENYSATTCPSTGDFEELIGHGAATMHPDDQKIFAETFDRRNLLSAHARGEKFVRLITRQIGDDGVYRRVETTDYFVKNPSVDDVLVITLCHNLE